MIQLIRWLLFPFACLYGLIVWARNRLFDKRILKSIEFAMPIVSVGNLSVGGTGKTPMVEYLVALLKEEYQVATLSRGYKRRSKGFVLADNKTTAEQIGDEPQQIKSKFPDIAVCVNEDRVLAIPELLNKEPDINLVLLDDGFQHRYLQADFEILLTAYGDLFSNDFYLPTGNLRDWKGAYQRANIIVVTKCPHNLSIQEQNKIREEINPFPHQKLYFSGIEYAHPYHCFEQTMEIDLGQVEEVLLVVGIANATSLENYLTSQVETIEQYRFTDHHYFTPREIEKIKRKFEGMQHSNKIILTTEKDATRLRLFQTELQDLPVYVLPIEMLFLAQQKEFDQQIKDFLANYEM